MKFYLLALAITLLLASCTKTASDITEPVTTSDAWQPEFFLYKWDEGGSAYLVAVEYIVSFNLPTSEELTNQNFNH